MLHLRSQTLKCVFMGNKHERLWGIKCVFMGNKHVCLWGKIRKMNVYGEMCDAPMLHLRSQTLKCVFMGKIRLKCVFMGKGSEFVYQTPVSDAKIRVFGV